MGSSLKQSVLKEIKDTFKKENPGVDQGIRLPGDIAFKDPENRHSDIIMEMSDTRLTENMQTDNAAFEAWCFVLRRWTKSFKKVCLKWSEPARPKNPHYQRFLYRVLCMDNRYEWFSISEDSMNNLENSVIKSNKLDLVVNSPASVCTTQKDVDEFLPKMSEVKLEAFIYEHSRSLKKLFDLDALYRQFPVGVFRNHKSNSTAVFPHKSAAIDLWGINKEDKHIYLFELKNSSNLKVGGVTELFFYSNLIHDMIKCEPIFKQIPTQDYYPDRGSKEDITSFTQMENISAYILAPTFHRLIDNKLMMEMNESHTQEREKAMKYGLIKLKKSYYAAIVE